MKINKKISKKINKKTETPVLTLDDLELFIKLNENFPETVKAEAENIPKMLQEDIIVDDIKSGRRKDLRHLKIITIDSETTKDVDDGVSLEITENGTYMLGVHIADVAEYVIEDSPIDIEARRRGTSVYLSDRVLPMLPVELSNGICSLDVGKNRYAISVFMEINHKGKVLRRKVCESIIRVHDKRTYKEIYNLLENSSEEERKQDSLYNLFCHMRLLSEILHMKRYKMGCIDFDFPETKVCLDDSANVIDIQEEKRDFSHDIIEEFMIICNETISEFFTRMHVPFMYREHKIPEKERLDELSDQLKGLGFTLDIKKDDIAEYKIQKLLEKVQNSPKKYLINTLVLRALPKAEYVTESEGHFAIATDYYSHFTAPIRRYPDLFIHRIIKKTLRGQMPQQERDRISSYADKLAQHCSETERYAQSMEMLDLNIKICQYMSNYLGESFEGTVISITSFGLFIRLDNCAEGLLFYNSMPEYMVFDPKRYVALAERSRRKISAGDRVKVTVARVDKHQGKIEFS